MDQLTFRDLTVAVLMNTSSGSCTPEAVDRMRTILAEHDVVPVHMWCGESKDLATGFEEISTYDPDVLIVLGGDGTIRSAAERTYASGKYLIPLPGGTMNVLPKALYGDASWEDILNSILQNPVPKVVSGGRIGSKRFFVSAICGGLTLWTDVREALREGNVFEALKQSTVAIGTTFTQKVHYTFNEMHEGEAEALTVTCPLVTSALDDDQKFFEAAIIDVRDAVDILGLATAKAFGSWRDARNTATVRTTAVTVSSEEGNVPIILDGEPIDTEKSVTIEFVPHAFTALVPAHEILS